MDDQLDELIEFLNSPRPDVRELAVGYLAGFSSPKSENFQKLVSRVDKLVQRLLIISHESPSSANNAMSILINLTSDISICKYFTDEDYLSMVIRLITNPTSIIADLASMLLSNLTKLENICRALVALNVGLVPGICNSTLALDQLTDVFVKGMDKKYNKYAEFGYLASVFADITNYPYGRRYFLERTAYDGKLPITKIMVFSEYPGIIRRGGVDSTMKNVCFDKEKHREILDPKETNMLPYILLPLCGPEEFDMEDMEDMPEEVQFLGDDKKREPDPKLRCTLLEAINLLCTTYCGRETLRAKKVYPVLREMHKEETDENCLDLNYRAVQLLMGDESKETTQDGKGTENSKPEASAFEEI
ncbi:Protein hgh1 [Coemansia spiralis]|uniref:Protein HGH1 homolog n=2 Tax=Coemansia TaxID=4863 RepID=A0A9W8G3T0_9FUNG|nr:Protein hgh1 [Coemansia umbellata]KAJ2620054.1 Protein hgh1 [Coemansia sp. RSA 1358]KAJ2672397.1 Protein hgh1 [Coemansia spiralis]